MFPLEDKDRENRGSKVTVIMSGFEATLFKSAKCVIFDIILSLCIIAAARKGLKVKVSMRSNFLIM